MPDRATTAQRNLLTLLLDRRGVLPRRRSANDYTGPVWRPIFRACGTPEPADPFSWPSVDAWFDSLDAVQASRGITWLQEHA